MFLLKFFSLCREDIESAMRYDPAANSSLEVALTYSGVHALWFYRVAHYLYLARLTTLARFISHLGRGLTGVEIHPASKIGRGLFIDHVMNMTVITVHVLIHVEYVKVQVLDLHVGMNQLFVMLMIAQCNVLQVM